MRAMSRFAETGRYLRIAYLESIGNKPLNTFIKHAESGLFDYAEWRNNDVGFGEEPRLIWASDSGRSLETVRERQDNARSGVRLGTSQGVNEASGRAIRTHETNGALGGNNTELAPDAGASSLFEDTADKGEAQFSTRELQEPEADEVKRRSRSAEILTQAQELYAGGVTPWAYAQKAGRDYDHKVAATLRGLQLCRPGFRFRDR